MTIVLVESDIVTYILLEETAIFPVTTEAIDRIMIALSGIAPAKGRDVTVPSGTGPRPGPDRDRTKLHGTTVWSGHGPKVVRSWSGASLDFRDRVGTGQDRSWTGPMLRRGRGDGY